MTALRMGVLSVALSLVLGACGNEDRQIEARMEHAAEFMRDELDPAVDGIWLRSGWVLTDQGEESLFPDTEEGWDEVVASAQNVIALTEELKTEEYSDNDPEWIAISDGLIVAAELARDAAQAREEQALFDAGGQMYRVCLACHQRYAMEAPE